MLYPKGYYDENPRELPESLQVLKGHDFHSITKMREAGNQNRTTLVRFRPKHVQALFEAFEGKIKKKSQALKTLEKKTAKERKAKEKELKLALQAVSTAQYELEELEEALGAAKRERDIAEAQIESLRKRTNSSSTSVSANAKELKKIKGAHITLRANAAELAQKNLRLDERLRDLQSESEQLRISLRNADKANEQLRNNLQIAEDLMKAKGIRLPEVEDTSGMRSASDVLGGSVALIRGNKPYPGSHGG